MAPNKSWMTLFSVDRLSDEYNEGIKDFVSFALDRLGEATQVIKCPCVKYCNSSEHTRDVVEIHLIAYGILEGYTFWYHHGEGADELEPHDDEMQEDFNVEEDLDGDSQSDDETDEMIKDLFPIYYGLTQKGVEMGASNAVDCTEEPNDDAKFFLG